MSNRKNAAAQKLGKLGGQARAEALKNKPKERSRIARMGGLARAAKATQMQASEK